MKFHNKVVKEIRNGNIKIEGESEKSTFEKARQLVTWHYHWIILHDFLNRILDPQQLDIVLKNGPSFYKLEPNQDPFIPVEFSVAAYRLGHSMIRRTYFYNREHISTPLEKLLALTHRSNRADDMLTVPVPTSWIIDWRRFFELDSAVPDEKFNFSRKLDPLLSSSLQQIPNVPMPNSLAVRNLIRGNRLELPSGQSVAKFMAEFMDFDPLTEDEISQGTDGEIASKHNFHRESPLWYYILKEAQIKADGQHLGQVGSRIVAEVFVGLLKADKDSFLAKNPEWKPTLPSKQAGQFTMTDLLNFVGDINPLGD